MPKSVLEHSYRHASFRQFFSVVNVTGGMYQEKKAVLAFVGTD